MTTAPSEDLLTLARWMAGDFSNQKQALAQPQTFAHIRVFFRPLPFAFFGTVGFYSEQTYDYDLWSPYRQGLHRLLDREGGIYIENYGLQDAGLYAGAGHDPEILATIPTDCLQPRRGCAMVFRREGDCFRGSVEPGNHCLIPRDGYWTYLVSEVELTESTWVSLDRGMDRETHRQIWGSQAGPLHFEKREGFDPPLPPLGKGG
ncbi:chromophore lyase CpcT/CpeT [Gloeobacter violaceus]|uniref:Chromophore lyase CpcT/CpeT 3 n=1 Tax=Gloeobacter violaceus (strain ATCC 29082 / PCC 7421) TaxID=251221 RepID=CPXT3_GLOVI|nr:chromophore lyase CpcT/CpeT [Gloeobacter violaceus]Q7NLD3.1 RecName: Full=Chromophore lyase CpcT/CpeT 3 [Gloeobacter violaceus PCC 7421]BAC89134.1 cpeT [Gloeobacter violaceus PCC 7421]